MKKDGRYRFTLQFAMDSEENVRAGELLERLGNKKSRVVMRYSWENGSSLEIALFLLHNSY